MTRVTFTRDLRSFRAGQVIQLPCPVAVLVGENGAGKSTLLRQLAFGTNAFARVDCHPMLPAFHHDFEFDSPRTKPFSSHRTDDDRAAALCSARLSHGESNLRLLKELDEAQNCRVLLDEPESGLSPKSCLKLCESIIGAASRGCEFVVATHSPILVWRLKNAYDVSGLKPVSYRDWLRRECGLEVA